MKIIITERQYRYLIENLSPCPEGKSEDELITVDDIKNGKTISKGYCNSSSNSAIVYIQKKLKETGHFVWDGNLGYFGDKTLDAICDFLGYEQCSDDLKFGKNTITKLESGATIPKKEETTTTNNSDFVITKNEAIKLFDGLTYNQKIVVTTLLYEAGGETSEGDPLAKEGMIAVAKVLKNRADTDFNGYGTTMAKQAIAKSPKAIHYQFSCWNNGIENAFKKERPHTGMKMAIYIMNNIDSLSDNTGGAHYYYAGDKPYWAKERKDTTWVATTKIGNHNFGNIITK
jgi:hypothetical protein